MKNRNKKDGEEKEKIIKIGTIISLVVIALWALTFFLFFYPDPARQGQFGDMFGAVNALFSGLAFAGLILTLILQKKELSLQRDELEQTRNEFVEQNKTLKRQRFENTFFNLMSLHQHITDNLEYDCPDGADPFEAKGREVFKKFYLEKNNFDETWGIKGYLEGKSVRQICNYHDFEVFNHYFHFFDGIMNYIDSSNLLENEERKQYAVMLRNTLSDNERYLIFYYYAANRGWHKEMAEKYSLFYDINPSYLADVEHYRLFEVQAYSE